jgi:hypothetical protein
MLNSPTLDVGVTFDDDSVAGHPYIRTTSLPRVGDVLDFGENGKWKVDYVEFREHTDGIHRPEVLVVRCPKVGKIVSSHG